MNIIEHLFQAHLCHCLYVRCPLLIICAQYQHMHDNAHPREVVSRPRWRTEWLEGRFGGTSLRTATFTIADSKTLRWTGISRLHCESNKKGRCWKQFFRKIGCRSRVGSTAVLGVLKAWSSGRAGCPIKQNQSIA